MTVQTERPPSGPAEVRKADGGGSGGPRKQARARAGALTPYLLLLPAVAATVLLLGWPLLKDGLLSFQNLNMGQLIQHVTEWNGFDNYQEVLTSSDFWRVTGRSIVFTLVNAVLIMVIGTLVGLLLARLGKRMRVLLLVGLVLAWAMPVVAATTVYQWLFAERFGVVNWVLDKLGWHSMADYSWTGSQMSTFFVVTVLIVWMSIPFVAINLYAATTTIPKELYEAASLDGAPGRASSRSPCRICGPSSTRRRSSRSSGSSRRSSRSSRSTAAAPTGSPRSCPCTRTSRASATSTSAWVRRSPS